MDLVKGAIILLQKGAMIILLLERLAQYFFGLPRQCPFLTTTGQRSAVITGFSGACRDV
jgi:hypothetical protein